MADHKPILFPKVSADRGQIKYPPGMGPHLNVSKVRSIEVDRFEPFFQKPDMPVLSTPSWMINPRESYPIDFDELPWDDQNLWSEYLAGLMAYDEAKRQREHQQKVDVSQPPGTMRLTDSQITRVANGHVGMSRVMTFGRHLPAYTALYGDRPASPGSMVTGGTIEATKPTAIPDYSASGGQKIVYVARAVNL